MLMVALTYLSIIRFSDAEAGDFLQSQLSADVLALENGESTFACYCEPKGRVLALLLVCRVDGAYFVILSSGLVLSIVNRLKIFVMRSKVSIEILSDCKVAGFQPGNMSVLTQDSAPVIPAPDGENYYVVAGGDMAVDTDESLQDAWKTSELKRGISWLCPETSAQFLPQMLGFDKLGAVNFRKGCYPGQEIVARTRYLGKVKRHPRLVCIKPAKCPAPLEKIQLLGHGEAFEAVIADCGQGPGGTCLFVVTRMEPDLLAEQIEYRGLVLGLL